MRWERTALLNALHDSLRDVLVDGLHGILGRFDGALVGHAHRGAEEADVADGDLTEHCDVFGLVFEKLKVFLMISEGYTGT